MTQSIPLAPALGLVAAGMAIATVLRKLYEAAQGVAENIYETNSLVNQYLVFHYGKPSEVCNHETGPKGALDFPVRVAAECWNAEAGKSNCSRALDIGCAVGRSSFELARHFEDVVGIDFSQHFIDVANDIKEHGMSSFG
ncbi:hypothetical protein SARC_12111 [Sphaeroforma arctica JP610]|uniref:Methyltransferase domain-containing protein n=1 Tax=Sphaeroforma arctica JP610 TaxID=667725 RepID=A0A0L0FH27_9EUKA|nr:hypothetical protein SARC_12111 [Sphaeroforma arctica JP610]KNC75363.1 hypothetical protein SARC_12111 [Sphaeroforma arctica JP610]|eukprot:XP_014149265.1 hypothetical protein SARC_12111 [Sphaeroforma arctica JP610]